MKRQLKIIILTLISVIMMGFAISVLNLVNLGTDPFTYMNLSIANHFDISFGNWQVFLNILMFIPVIFFDRRQIGIGTIFNMVLVGYSVEVFTYLWNMLSIEHFFDIMAVRILVMIPALILFIFSAAVYMSANLGTAPYDALPFILAGKFHRLPFKYIRFLWDCLAISIGFFISGKVGIVTIAMALFMGQTVAFVKETFMKQFTSSENLPKK